ncbi:glycine-rich protein 2-like [Cornus florida]|uniref:glycine-rich protein 2-like n=1 Tax=Cornus florida TaxID=4283 RepID=UPI00289E484E|nr:glycine-rich protein 2-like [Cornus florida]
MVGSGGSSKSVESESVVEETPPGLLAKQGEGEGRTVRARDEQTVIQTYPDSSPQSDPMDEVKPIRVDGVVKQFDPVIGFGIIFPSVGDDILEVHRSSIRDGGVFGLVEGESVEFFVKYTKNRIKAVDVTGPMESLTQGAIRRDGDGYYVNKGVIGGYVLGIKSTEVGIMAAAVGTEVGMIALYL